MPRGSLDGRTAGRLESEILRLCAAGFSAIEVDLRALHFTEPAGSRLRHRLHALADRHDVTLALDAGASRARLAG